MVLALLGFMQPLRTRGKAECGAEYLWGRSSVPDPISEVVFTHILQWPQTHVQQKLHQSAASKQLLLAPAFLPQLMSYAQDVSMDSPVLQGL